MEKSAKEIIQNIKKDNVLLIIGGVSFVVAIYNQYELGLKLSLITLFLGIIFKLFYDVIKEIITIILEDNQNTIIWISYYAFIAILFIFIGIYIFLVNKIIPFF